MTLRFDGDSSNEGRLSNRKYDAALRVEQAAQAIRLGPSGDTLIGAQALVDALDIYWQERYGGRVLIVNPPAREADR